MKEKNGNIYVCHTYYHVYISMLKEMALPKEKQGNAYLVLSKMSNDFEELPERLKKTGFFKEIFDFDEKNREEFPELKKYYQPSGNMIKKIFNRIIFTKKYAQMQEPYIPTDFSKYENVYVFCDSDPIGYYLNKKHIYYHAVEDGLDTLVNRDWARNDNAGHFGFKAFLSKRLNLIFIQNGYGKYCLDMEVNCIEKLKYPCKYYVQQPRKELTDRLTSDEKQLLLDAFVKKADEIRKIFDDKSKKKVLILTEPLTTLDVRKTIFEDIIASYKGEYEIILKQHPRDELDYEKEFSDYLLIDRSVPMEMLNFFENLHVDVVVSVFTELGNIYFADEKVRLGRDFMDAYEDIERHKASFASE